MVYRGFPIIHDFAHRTREAGWTLEEVAYYLGHVTMKGTPRFFLVIKPEFLPLDEP
jgi:hypothetical protein